MEFPDCELEFHKLWSAAAARYDAWRAISSLLLNKAGFQFSAGYDEQAKLLRDIAYEIRGEFVEPAQDELVAYITESKRRK